MRKLLFSAGNYMFEEEVINNAFMGGKIIATHKETGKITSRPFKRYHNGKDNKLQVLKQIVTELIPPETVENIQTISSKNEPPIKVEFEENPAIKEIN